MNRPTLSLVLAAALLLPAGFAAAETETPPTLAYFAADSDALDEAAEGVLFSFAADYVVGDSEEPVQIVGHGDPSEVAQYGEQADDYCVGLAQRRAANARNYLVEHGIPDGVITTMTLGCSSPLDGVTGAKNQRVEVALTDTVW